MQRSIFKYLLGFLIAAGLLVGLGFAAWHFLSSDERRAETVSSAETGEAVAPIQPILPDFIDLQPVVDQWLTTYNHGKVAILIYDFDHDQIAASYNPDAQMLPASVYKLFYTYDAYRQIDAGLDDPDQIYWSTYTLGECLDLMIRESHNPCAETMLDDPPRAQRVAQLIREQGMTQTIPTALMTSASNVMKLLQLYYQHDGWSDDSWAKFRDSALDQPPTAAGDFRQGLPSGFQTAQVYNKVGWSAVGGGWDIYNDVALVDFPETTDASGQPIAARHYGMVILTRSTSHLAISDLGEMLEQAILAPVSATSAAGDTLIETSE